MARKKVKKPAKIKKMTAKEKKALLAVAKVETKKPKKAKKPMEPEVVSVDPGPKKRKRRTKAEMIAAKATENPVATPVETVPVEKKKRKVSPERAAKKVEILAEREEKKKAREAKRAEKEEKRTRKKRRTKEEIAQDKLEKKVNNDPIFINGARKKLESSELRNYLRERYLPNAGVRIVDYILQMCDEHEKMEIELAKERMITKTLSETLKS